MMSFWRLNLVGESVFLWWRDERGERRGEERGGECFKVIEGDGFYKVSKCKVLWDIIYSE